VKHSYALEIVRPYRLGVATLLTALALASGCSKGAPAASSSPETAAGAAVGGGAPISSPSGGAAGTTPLVLAVNDAGARPDAPTEDALPGRAHPDIFPQQPVIEQSAPADAAAAFGSPATADPLCLTEPPDGALFPQNWLRARFSWMPVAGASVYQLRVHAEGQQNDLVVYTADPSWTMRKEWWNDLVVSAVNVPIEVTVRAAGAGKPLGQAKSTMRVAPVSAPGSIIYWSIQGESAELKGFYVGDEGVGSVLAPEQVQMTWDGKKAQCVGCHSSTPDGKAVTFSVELPQYGNGYASIEKGSVGAAPTWLTPGSAVPLGSDLGLNALSKAHWRDGDRIQISRSGASPATLVWTSLETGASGEIQRQGDVGEPWSPSFSHDGLTIAYASAPSIGTLGYLTGNADLFTVPYQNQQGGVATPVGGAAEANKHEYYPAFSPDDQLLAFAYAPVASPTLYDAKQAEIAVVAARGGTAVRLAANDAPACLGLASPGLSNSWPKWSPEARSAGGSTYYFLTFSSRRVPGHDNPQLYITPIVRDAGGTISTYPAIYLWNQPPSESNHTPSWDVTEIEHAPPQVR